MLRIKNIYYWLGLFFINRLFFVYSGTNIVLSHRLDKARMIVYTTSNFSPRSLILRTGASSTLGGVLFFCTTVSFSKSTCNNSS